MDPKLFKKKLKELKKQQPPKIITFLVGEQRQKRILPIIIQMQDVADDLAKQNKPVSACQEMLLKYYERKARRAGPGRKWTEEQKAKKSAAMKGNRNGNKDK